MEEGNHRAREGLNKAQKLLKQSKKRDYYKILGVKRYDFLNANGLNDIPLTLSFSLSLPNNAGLEKLSLSRSQ